MVMSAAVLFVVVYQGTGAQMRSQIRRDITGDANQLSQALLQATTGSSQQLAAAAARFLRGQPYAATSRLQFVLVPGAPTLSNQPEVFGGRGPEAGETPVEQAKENREGGQLLHARLGYSTQRVPEVGTLLTLKRRVDLGAVVAVVGAGEPLTAVEQAQHGVARAFLLAGAATLVLAVLASYFAGAGASAPLRGMATVATQVDAGDLYPRMEIPRRRGDEVRVLAEAFNHMLDRLEEAFASQREFIADASHELRTPLTVIRGQLEVLAAQRRPSEAEVRRVERVVQAEITRLSRLVDDLLVLAQADRLDFLRLESIAVRPFVTELWDGESLTAQRRFELGPVPDGSLQADPDRLAQALRNLARNAIEHTTEKTGLVRLEVTRRAADKLAFAVVDDGPGIPLDQRERVFERFHRIDPARARSAGGAGLGLAIVNAIAEAHGGEVQVRDPVVGRGAVVEIVVPGFRPHEGAISHGWR
jgi:signal transduction histidine kinase